MSKTTKAPCTDCACKNAKKVTDDDVRAKEIEWYDSMIQTHKQQAIESAKQAKWGMALMVVSAIAMVTIIVVNIISFFTKGQ